MSDDQSAATDTVPQTKTEAEQPQRPPPTASEWIKATVQFVFGIVILAVIGIVVLAFVFSGDIIEQQADELAGAEWTRGHLNGVQWVETMKDPGVAWGQKERIAQLVAADMLADPEVRAMPEVRNKGKKGLERFHFLCIAYPQCLKQLAASDGVIRSSTACIESQRADLVRKASDLRSCLIFENTISIGFKSGE